MNLDDFDEEDELAPDPVSHNARLRDEIRRHITELLELNSPSAEQQQAILRLKEASFWLDEDLRARILLEKYQPK